jgi:tRNA pseudouridine55 synthase
MLPFLSSFTGVDYTQGTLILVDKPKGWTSFDVVNKIRGTIRHKYNIRNIKVGHSGTLDPMATGLLLICTGAWTKKLYDLQGLDKKYSAGITLGVETNTYDAEGEVAFKRSVPSINAEELRTMLKGFTGLIQQVPPVYSAIKKDGKPLYAHARAGKEMTPEPRHVMVYDIEIIHQSTEQLDLLIHCGSGFYVRSLAHDIGVKLGCGAHLSSLVRLTVGPYELNNAHSMEALIQML